MAIMSAYYGLFSQDSDFDQWENARILSEDSGHILKFGMFKKMIVS